jgi:hypothetical protein
VTDPPADAEAEPPPRQRECPVSPVWDAVLAGLLQVVYLVAAARQQEALAVMARALAVLVDLAHELRRRR